MYGGKATAPGRKRSGEAIQEACLLGDNAEDVDADLQREPLCLVHKPNRIFALSGTSVSAANGEGPSVPMTFQATGVSVPLQEPAKDTVALILQISPREVPVTRPPTPTTDISTPILQTSAIDVPVPRPPSPTRDVSMPILQTSARGVSD